MGAIAAATRPDPHQRLHPAVHRGRVPRLGTDPGPALHRRQPTSVVAPQKVRPQHLCRRLPAGDVMYQAVRRAFFLVPAERIHLWLFRGLRMGTTPGSARRALKKRLAPHDQVLASTVFGDRFPGPMGLAAGYDKDGAGLTAWGALGFGYAEVGTVTAQPQPGNPPPRLFRLPDD